jgi:hypothetical protein
MFIFCHLFIKLLAKQMSRKSESAFESLKHDGCLQRIFRIWSQR